MAPKKLYSKEQMNMALELVQRGSSIASAAKQAKVPRVTLLYKVSGKSPKSCSMGPPSSLTCEEETMLVQWILELTKIHYPISKVQLFDSVEYIIKKKPRKNFFVNGRPGDTWFKNFLKRHPELTTRVSQNLTISRDSVSEKQIRNWFSEIQEYLTNENLYEITTEPDRVFNTDEIAFVLNPKDDRVITIKGEKNVYQVSGDEKENLTVLVTANASGKFAPPMIVYKYTRVPSHVAENVPESWGIGTSENGWMCGTTFFGYMVNIFVPWLEKENIPRPVLLFLDGHVSHMTLQLSEFCSLNKIILIALYPNSTHLLQPMDVSVFRPLKCRWKKEVKNWRFQNNGVKLQKANFAPIFKKALEQISPETVQNGFRVSGLSPFNVDNVNFNKISVKKRVINVDTSSSNLNPSLDAHTLLKAIEERIGQPKIDLFLDSLLNSLPCPVEDSSLFTLWKSLYQEKQNNEAPQDLVVNNVNDQQDNEASQDIVLNKINDQIPVTEQDTVLDQSSIVDECESIVDENLGISCENLKQKDAADEATQQCSSTSSAITLPLDLPSPYKYVLNFPEASAFKKKQTKTKISSVISSQKWQDFNRKKQDLKLKTMQEKKERALLREKKKIEKEQKIDGVKKRVFIDSDKKGKKLQTKKKKITKTKEFDSSDSQSEEEWVPSDSTSESNNEFDESINYNENRDPNENNFKLDLNKNKDDTIKVSDYILVAFPSEKKSFKNYVCVVQEVLSKDEAEVVGMICCNKEKTMFKLNDKDVSVINFSQVIKKMEFPKMLLAGDRLKYEFSEPLDVEEPNAS